MDEYHHRHIRCCLYSQHMVFQIDGREILAAAPRKGLLKLSRTICGVTLGSVHVFNFNCVADSFRWNHQLVQRCDSLRLSAILRANRTGFDGNITCRSYMAKVLYSFLYELLFAAIFALYLNHLYVNQEI